jgi:hypothetical protein
MQGEQWQRPGTTIMEWSNDKLARIPQPYRDFMLALKPVIDTRKPGTALRITGIPFGRIYGVLSEVYSYTPEQVRQLADNLSQAGYVREDSLGFFTPTGPGEALLLALASVDDTSYGVPPLPSFAEN